MLGAIDPDAIEECIAGQAVLAETSDRQRGKSLSWSFGQTSPAASKEPARNRQHTVSFLFEAAPIDPQC